MRCGGHCDKSTIYTGTSLPHSLPYSLTPLLTYIFSPEVVQAIEQLRFNKDYYFQFNLRVADDTAEYDLIAYNKDAEHLLGGITAEKFISNLDT